MAERKAKGMCHERPSSRDLISRLPDYLISHILFYLPTKVTKEAVRTSVLSSRWKSLWLLVSELDLDTFDFPDYNAFVGFIDRFLGFCREHKSCLHKLKLNILKRKNDQSCVTRWIDSVARRKIKHLDVGYRYVSRKRLEVIPLSLYACETLVYLRLNRVLVGSFETVSLPRLKTMRLENNAYASDTGLESLISSCSVLEDLSIVRRLDDNVRVLRVHSQTITSLKVEFDRGPDHGFFYFNWDSLALFIDAPRLEYLHLDHELSPSKFISNLGSLVKVDFVDDVRIADRYDEGCLSKQEMVRNFFNGISSVRDLIISPLTMESISSYFKVEPFPRFCDLSSLEVGVCLRRLEILGMLPTLLESFPSLKSIVLGLTDWTVDTPSITLSSVRQFLFSSLELVEIKSRSEADFVWMELARYFAENSVILKKLVVRWERSKLEEDSVLRDLLALSWRSSTCQIEVCGPLKRLVGFEIDDSGMLFHYFHREILGLFIDSPRLKHLNFNDDVSKCQVISSLSPSVLGCVRYMSYYSDGVGYSNQQMVRNFFTCISSVRDLVISDNIMKLIYSCFKAEPLPQFSDLSCLEAKVCLVDVEVLPTLLESCPILKSIVLDLTRPTIVTEQITVSAVPQCLLSSLEFVELNCCCKAELVAMKLAKYFAENSVFLKKLVLRWRGYVLEEDSVLRDLLALSWRPSTYQIEVCGPLKKTCR